MSRLLCTLLAAAIFAGAPAGGAKPPAKSKKADAAKQEAKGLNTVQGFGGAITAPPPPKSDDGKSRRK